MQVDRGTEKSRSLLGRILVRAVCLVVAGVTLSGCIIAPYPGYYRPQPRYFYYR